MSPTIRSAYYLIKPIIPRSIQIWLRRKYVKRKMAVSEGLWPIDPRSSTRPEGFPGWPEGKRFAVVLTHDVETAKGHTLCPLLMQLEKDLGFRSSFNFVPRRYDVNPELRSILVNNGFEVGVHGLYHDGKLFNSKSVFLERAEIINEYIRQWGAVGFRSPAMHCNPQWIHALHIRYDLSRFDTDPFEPQSEGTGTIFPYFVKDGGKQPGYVELPYTLVQDFTLFVLMQEKDNAVWRKKLDWIAENGGMVLLNTHPDYMRFDGLKPAMDEYPADYYTDLLRYIAGRYEGQYYHALPKELADMWHCLVRPESRP